MLSLHYNYKSSRVKCLHLYFFVLWWGNVVLLRGFDAKEKEKGSSFTNKKEGAFKNSRIASQSRGSALPVTSSQTLPPIREDAKFESFLVGPDLARIAIQALQGAGWTVQECILKFAAEVDDREAQVYFNSLLHEHVTTNEPNDKQTKLLRSEDRELETFLTAIKTTIDSIANPPLQLAKEFSCLYSWRSRLNKDFVFAFLIRFDLLHPLVVALELDNEEGLLTVNPDRLKETLILVLSLGKFERCNVQVEQLALPPVGDREENELRIERVDHRNVLMKTTDDAEHQLASDCQRHSLAFTNSAGDTAEGSAFIVECNGERSIDKDMLEFFFNPEYTVRNDTPIVNKLQRLYRQEFGQSVLGLIEGAIAKRVGQELTPIITKKSHQFLVHDGNGIEYRSETGCLFFTLKNDSSQVDYRLNARVCARWRFDDDKSAFKLYSLEASGPDRQVIVDALTGRPFEQPFGKDYQHHVLFCFMRAVETTTYKSAELDELKTLAYECFTLFYRSDEIFRSYLANQGLLSLILARSDCQKYQSLKRITAEDLEKNMRYAIEINFWQKKFQTTLQAAMSATANLSETIDELLIDLKHINHIPWQPGMANLSAIAFVLNSLLTVVGDSLIKEKLATITAYVEDPKAVPIITLCEPGALFYQAFTLKQRFDEEKKIFEKTIINVSPRFESQEDLQYKALLDIELNILNSLGHLLDSLLCQLSITDGQNPTLFCVASWVLALDYVLVSIKNFSTPIQFKGTDEGQGEYKRRVNSLNTVLSALDITYLTSLVNKFPLDRFEQSSETIKEELNTDVASFALKEDNIGDKRLLNALKTFFNAQALKAHNQIDYCGATEILPSMKLKQAILCYLANFPLGEQSTKVADLLTLLNKTDNVGNLMGWIVENYSALSQLSVHGQQTLAAYLSPTAPVQLTPADVGMAFPLFQEMLTIDAATFTKIKPDVLVFLAGQGDVTSSPEAAEHLPGAIVNAVNAHNTHQVSREARETSQNTKIEQLKKLIDASCAEVKKGGWKRGGEQLKSDYYPELGINSNHRATSFLAKALNTQDIISAFTDQSQSWDDFVDKLINKLTEQKLGTSWWNTFCGRTNKTTLFYGAIKCAATNKAKQAAFANFTSNPVE